MGARGSTTSSLDKSKIVKNEKMKSKKPTRIGIHCLAGLGRYVNRHISNKNSY